MRAVRARPRRLPPRRPPESWFDRATDPYGSARGRHTRGAPVCHRRLAQRGALDQLIDRRNLSKGRHGRGCDGRSDRIASKEFLLMPDHPRVLPDRPFPVRSSGSGLYADLSEQPTDEELAKLHPELRDGRCSARRRCRFRSRRCFRSSTGDGLRAGGRAGQASDEYVEMTIDGASGTARGSIPAIGRCGCATSTSWSAARRRRVPTCWSTTGRCRTRESCGCRWCGF